MKVHIRKSGTEQQRSVVRLRPTQTSTEGAQASVSEADPVVVVET
jgi:hypothetical protein